MPYRYQPMYLFCILSYSDYPQEMEMVSPNFEKGTPLSKGYPFFIRLPTSNAYTTMKKVSEEIRTVHGTAMRMA